MIKEYHTRYERSEAIIPTIVCSYLVFLSWPEIDDTVETTTTKAILKRKTDIDSCYCDFRTTPGSCLSRLDAWIDTDDVDVYSC